MFRHELCSSQVSNSSKKNIQSIIVDRALRKWNESWINTVTESKLLKNNMYPSKTAVQEFYEEVLAQLRVADTTRCHLWRNLRCVKFTMNPGLCTLIKCKKVRGLQIRERYIVGIFQGCSPEWFNTNDIETIRITLLGRS